ncbi:MAG: alpha/beta hydrolase [Actinomycetota bacterium]|nr:alpha/beta hydrolase [Actinomycetota bacterium]
MTDTTGRRADIPVSGGELATHRLGNARAGSPLVLAIHGITSNSQAWRAVSRAVGDRATLACVDLRGRADSAELPPPFGIPAHVADMVAVLDHLEREQAVVVGHSLGAYIAAALAVAHPQRIRSLVLVDGGLSIPAARDADPETFMHAFLGPTLARLQMDFPSPEAYRAWWAEHPALAGADVDRADVAAYADHDLRGPAGKLRSSVNSEAIGPDGEDVLRATDAEHLTVPAVLLCAPRGMIDDPNPMQPLELVTRWARADSERRRSLQVPDVNHYTIVLGRRGASAVAAEIVNAVG